MALIIPFSRVWGARVPVEIRSGVERWSWRAQVYYWLVFITPIAGFYVYLWRSAAA
jgi:hypothetical protein